MNGGDGYTTQWIYLKPLNCTVLNGGFMWCILCHNKIFINIKCLGYQGWTARGLANTHSLFLY